MHISSHSILTKDGGHHGSPILGVTGSLVIELQRRLSVDALKFFKDSWNELSELSYLTYHLLDNHLLDINDQKLMKLKDLIFSEFFFFFVAQ